MQNLTEKVIEQIKKDIENGDVTALECLLDNCDKGLLKDYLSEEG